MNDSAQMRVKRANMENSEIFPHSRPTINVEFKATSCSGSIGEFSRPLVVGWAPGQLMRRGGGA